MSKSNSSVFLIMLFCSFYSVCAHKYHCIARIIVLAFYIKCMFLVLWAISIYSADLFVQSSIIDQANCTQVKSTVKILLCGGGEGEPLSIYSMTSVLRSWPHRTVANRQQYPLPDQALVLGATPGQPSPATAWGRATPWPINLDRWSTIRLHWHS